MDFVALLSLAKAAHRLTLSSSILILLHFICCISGLRISFHFSIQKTAHNKTSVFLSSIAEIVSILLCWYLRKCQNTKAVWCFTVISCRGTLWFHNVLFYVCQTNVLNTPIASLQVRISGSQTFSQQTHPNAGLFPTLNSSRTHLFFSVSTFPQITLIHHRPTRRCNPLHSNFPVHTYGPGNTQRRAQKEERAEGDGWQFLFSCQ